MAWLVIAALVTLGLAGTAKAQTGNPMHDQLSGLTETGRHTELFRAINGGGNSCQAVTGVYFAGLDGARAAYWDTRCREGTMWRLTLPAMRNARPSLTQCGAASGGLAAGPCFQPLGTAASTAAQTAGGRGTAVAGSAPAEAPPGSRYGAIYVTQPPLAAYGFGNGNTDRLAVNTGAVRACQGMAGRIPCVFQEELVNKCGALVQGVTRHPNAVAITSDLSTVVLNRNFIGTGATVQEAERNAMAACRGLPNVT
jgi:hypothetical protein